MVWFSNPPDGLAPKESTMEKMGCFLIEKWKHFGPFLDKAT